MAKNTAKMPIEIGRKCVIILCTVLFILSVTAVTFLILYVNERDKNNTQDTKGPKLGENCDLNGPLKCKDENAECDSSTYRCQCVETYFDNDDNKNNVGGVCVFELPLGSTCEVDGGIKCHDVNAKCTTDIFGASKCTCKDRLYDDNGSAAGGTCIAPNVDLGSRCSHSNECKALYSECVTIGNSSTATCSCIQGATANALGKCEYRPKLGEECDPNGPFKCMDENAKCDSSTNRCQCVEKYFDNDDNKNNVGGVCLSDKTDDGDFCKISDERYAFCYHGCCHEDDNIKCCKDPFRKPWLIVLVIVLGVLLVVTILILIACLCYQRCKRSEIKETHNKD